MSDESPDLVELKNFSTRLLTVENSSSKIPLPVWARAQASQVKKKIKNIFEKTWQDEFESYNSQTRQLERATKCSLKIDQRTDKREYPVEVKRLKKLLASRKLWKLGTQVWSKDENIFFFNSEWVRRWWKSATEIELKSLILAQIERWRHALHMQVERQHGELALWWRVANGWVIHRNVSCCGG